jgi:small subunit ribosomal protein S8
MSMTDPIADLLTRIRNGNKAKFEKVVIPSSKMKVNIVEILKQEGYISGYEVVKDEYQGKIEIFLKYGLNKQSIITGLKRISKPGLRIYVNKDDIPKVLNGIGISILSTSSGLLTDRNARKKGLGGEVLCEVW